jgi:arylsulfatase A-like enzyme
LTTLTNLIATIADVTDTTLAEGVGQDSQSILPVLLGGESDPLNTVIHHSSRGMFAVRKGQWKFIEGLGSGGYSQPTWIEPTLGEPDGQLYNMAVDPGEQNDLFTENPQRVEEMRAELDRIRKKN